MIINGATTRVYNGRNSYASGAAVFWRLRVRSSVKFWWVNLGDEEILGCRKVAQGALAAMNIGKPVVFKEKQFEEKEREREREREAKVVYFRDVESFVN